MAEIWNWMDCQGRKIWDGSPLIYWKKRRFSKGIWTFKHLCKKKNNNNENLRWKYVDFWERWLFCTVGICSFEYECGQRAFEHSKNNACEQMKIFRWKHIDKRCDNIATESLGYFCITVNKGNLSILSKCEE